MTEKTTLGSHGTGSHQIIAFSGHIPDTPDREFPRFPVENEGAASHAIAAILADWGVGPGDHCLCGGARGGDLLFAEACLVADAKVELLLALPYEEFIARSVAEPDTDWEARFRAVAHRSRVRVIDLKNSDESTPTSPFGLLNQRLLEEAIALAAPDQPKILVLWDSIPSESGRPGTGDFVERAKLSGIAVRAIDPFMPRERGK